MIEYIVTENKRSGKQSAFIMKNEKEEPLVIMEINPDHLRELIDQEHNMEVGR